MRKVPELRQSGHRNPTQFPTNYKPARTFDEIAAAMGLTRQTVWHLYARALNKIRRELRRHPRRYDTMLSE